MTVRSFVLLTACLTICLNAHAAAPRLVPLQGILTNPAGEPLEGDTQFEFSIYDSETEGILLWTETQWILVERGLLSTYLGSATPLDLSVFRDHSELWLGIKVGDDPAMPRVFLGSVPYSGFAEYTGNDSLSVLTCTEGQVAKFNGSEWACADDVDTDTQLSEAQVDDYVANNGYITSCGIDYTDCVWSDTLTECHGVFNIEHCWPAGYVVVGVDNSSVSGAACCRFTCN